MSRTELTWENVRDKLPVGTRIQGRVTQHWPFGVFVEIPRIPFQGLVQLTDFRDEGRMTPDQYPEVGSLVDAVVLGFKETGKQIWLGMKPSQLCRSKGADTSKCPSKEARWPPEENSGAREAHPDESVP